MDKKKVKNDSDHDVRNGILEARYLVMELLKVLERIEKGYNLQQERDRDEC